MMLGIPKGWVGMGLLGLLLGCVRHRAPDADLPRLSVAQVITLVPTAVSQREAWGKDIEGALRAHGLVPTLLSVCSVIAVVEQESGFKENPAVPGLTELVREKLQSYASKLGPWGNGALAQLLEQRAPGTTRTFEERIARLKTEQDVDLLFQDLLSFARGRHPQLFRLTNVVTRLVRDEALTDLNPITTAGSMQVSVRFSEELAKEKGLEPTRVRAQLYTREGGLYYGAWRLLGHRLSEERTLHRFADYNAGQYASRNAALQAQVSRVTGHKLSLDGDFLAYDKHGDPLDRMTRSWEAVLLFRDRFAKELSDRQVEKDLRQEKSHRFEETATYRSIKATYRHVAGAVPAYARLPEVALVSPKLSRQRSTAWFAQSVEQRYQHCVDRARATPAAFTAHPENLTR